MATHLQKSFMCCFPYFVFFSILYLEACGGASSAQKPARIAAATQPKATVISRKEPAVVCDTLLSFQTIAVAGHWTDIAIPSHDKKIIGNILILQGWDFPKDDWCKKSSLCQKALAKGYRLIMPEMGRSTYQSQNYPETRADLRQYPTRKWLTDTLIPYLQKRYCLLQTDQSNFILGLSTGARGAGLVTMNLPDLFKAVAALSGDYDQTGIPADRIMTAFYGSYQKFSERWAGEDNMVVNVAKFKTPFYLGHGKLDKICPPNQTELFYNALHKAHPNLKIKLNMPAWAAHDYKYWDYEVDNIFAFFESVLE
jgi:esterase/lipase superfamily enzyme